MIAGAFLMMVSGGAIVGTKVIIDQATSNIAQDDLLGIAGTNDQGGNDLDGPINMLLLGVDLRKGWDKNDTRADTIIILHIPATHDQAYLISIPRDTEVTAPAFPKSGFQGGVGKITDMFHAGAQNGGEWSGGAQLVAQTIKNFSGITFNGAAIIDFSGFKGIIDALGSVRMCVDQEVESIHMLTRERDGYPVYISDKERHSGEKLNPVVYKKGCREMKGWEALDYSRQRYGLDNGDYDRQKNQQQLVKAIAKKAVDSGAMTNPMKINELMKAAGEAFVLDTAGTPVADFVFTLRGVAANDMVMLRTNGGTFNGNNSGREALQPISLEMFEAVKNDRLAEFVMNNPTVMANNKS
ncbi:LCP family protein [Polymorphospora lycopeni]|uniref:LCP family protein n=1 Tax=Polymorphospora lycopeni TaxID=3140240 RepID=A0ABV5CQA9_9ACTN